MSNYERDEFQGTGPFDYYLSAFLSAAMTVRNSFQVRQDRKPNAAIKAWCRQWEDSLTPEEKVIYDFMRKDRAATAIPFRDC